MYAPLAGVSGSYYSDAYLVGGYLADGYRPGGYLPGGYLTGGFPYTFGAAEGRVVVVRPRFVNINV